VVHDPRMSGAQMLGSPVRAGVGGVAHPDAAYFLRLATALRIKAARIPQARQAS